jgi:spore germination protein (amino acid permease)
MLNQVENKVGLKEYTAILIIAMGLKPTDSTPTALLQYGKNAGWMIPLVSSIIVFLSLSCLLALLERYKDKNLVEIIYHLLGKYIGFLIAFIIGSSLIVLTASNIRNYVDIMSTIYFPRTPTIVLTLILAGGSAIMAKLGFEAIGRTAWMVLPWILVIVVFFIMLIFNLLKFKYIYPIFGAGIKQILKGGIINSTIFSEVITFAIAFPQVKNYKSFKNSSYIALWYAVIEISLFTALYLMSMDYPPVIINASLFHTVARLIYGGRFISNLEAFFFLFWIIAAVLRFSIYIYTNTAIISYAIRLKEVEPLVYAIFGLIVIIAMIPENILQNVLILKKILINLDWIPIFLTPLVLLFISQWKGDYKK